MFEMTSLNSSKKAKQQLTRKKDLINKQKEFELEEKNINDTVENIDNINDQMVTDTVTTQSELVTNNNTNDNTGGGEVQDTQQSFA